MPTVGFGFWGVLVWIAISSISPLRALAYERFIILHALSAAGFLYLMALHFSRAHRQLVTPSAAILALDTIARLGCLLYQSARWPPCRCCSGARVGYNTLVRDDGPDITMLTITGVHFPWHPGQHILVWMPRLWL